MYVIGIGGRKTDDYEYYKIMLELISLGITPSGDKIADKSRLKLEKNKLIHKIANVKAKENTSKESKFAETLNTVQEADIERRNLEKQKLGAMKVAELKRLYFGI